MINRKNIPSDEILEIFQNLKISKDWSFKGTSRTETGKWTHSYHRYPAKFIPQLVEKLFSNYIKKEEAYINDPFMGSGTTIISAISRGYRASGTDINGIAYLMTKVKSTPIYPLYLRKKIDSFISKISKQAGENILFGYYDEIEPTIPTQHIDRINYWYNQDNQKVLGRLLTIINREEDKTFKDFLKIAFSQILKNCSIWLQTSTKPTRDKKKRIADPVNSIKLQLKKMEKGNIKYYEQVPKKVKGNLNYYLNIHKNDARNQPVENNSVDLIVTSSPYVTSYEYADLHELSSIWLEFTDDLKEYRKDFIGTAFKEPGKDFNKSIIGKEIVLKMINKSKKVSAEINTYFRDMKEVFDESYRILKHGAHCCYVIGNTKLKGVEILNAEVFSESLMLSGFILEDVIKREIPSKILPQKRDEKTGRFANNHNANTQAYPVEYIIIGRKE